MQYGVVDYFVVNCYKRLPVIPWICRHDWIIVRRLIIVGLLGALLIRWL